MQSIKQYRRFGRLVRRQYEQDRFRVEALSDAALGLDSSPPPSPTSTVINSANSSTALLADHAVKETEDDEAPRNSESSHSDFPKRSSQDDRPPGADEESGENGRPSNLYRAITANHPKGTALATSMAGIEVRQWAGRKSRRGQQGKTAMKVFVVGFEGDHDVMNPHNWSKLIRFAATINIAMISLSVGFASSVDSAVLKKASAEFGVSQIVESLATGLFLVGFGVGALFAGPISETVGRNPVYIATLSLYMVFILASALAPDIGAQLTFRFLAGCFASTPLTCAGGSLSDLWSPMERIYSFPIFACGAFMGPVIGPIIGGFIAESSTTSWRWTEWITLIFSGFVLTSITLFQPETYTPILMKWKAARLRDLTHDDRYRGEIEIRQDSLMTRLGQSLYRPFLLTFTEPIIILVAFYLTLTYMIQFTFLNGYTFIFVDTYGFSPSQRGLCFIGIGIGLVLATLLLFVVYPLGKRKLAKVQRQGGDTLPPEFKLWYAMLGAPAIPISMFWMGWTARADISYWSPLAASILCGFGILTIFISSYQYIIDTYEGYSASALTSVTLIRYVVAGGMLEAAVPMYQNLGVNWTLTIVGVLSAVMAPVPYLFWRYGVKIRSWSKHAAV